jgi:hypothetical protein
MALVDLIANSGAQNYERMRKGWLPTAEETNARKMSELGIQQQQQNLEYEPERRARAEAAEQRKIKRAEQETALHDKTMSGLKTKEAVDEKQRKLDVTTRFVRGAYSRFTETNNISDAKQIVRDNLDAILEAGDDNSDKQINRFLSEDIPDKEAKQLLAGVNSTLPSVQKALDKQKGKLNSFEKTLIGMTPKQRQEAITERNKVLTNRSTKNKLVTTDDGVVIVDQNNNTVTKVIEDGKQVKTAEQEISQAKFDYTQIKDKSKRTDKFKGDYKKDSESLIKFNSNLDEIMIILNSENNALTDKLLTAKLMNLEKTSIRAMGFYEVFDKPMGNIGARLKDLVVGFLGGKRDQGQLDIIRSTVEQLQEKSKPALKGRARFSRTIADENGLNPFKVVPPTSAIDILESPLIDKKEKIRLLEKYGSTFKK